MKHLKVLGVVAIVLCLVVSVFAEYVPFKVKLSANERLNIMSLLPQEGNVLALQTIRDLSQELTLTIEEQQILGFEYDENGNIVNFNKIDWTKLPEKEFTLGEIAKGLIVNALKKLNKEEKLPMYFLSVYQKFVGDN